MATPPQPNNNISEQVPLPEPLPSNDINRLAVMREEWAAESETIGMMNGTSSDGQGLMNSKTYAPGRATTFTNLTMPDVPHDLLTELSQQSAEFYGVGYDIVTAKQLPGQPGAGSRLSELDECSWAARSSMTSSGLDNRSSETFVGNGERSENVVGLDGEQRDLLKRVRRLVEAVERRECGAAARDGDEEVLRWGRNVTVCVEFA